jgi:hypothetical protein
MGSSIGSKIDEKILDSINEREVNQLQRANDSIPSSLIFQESG